MADAWQLKGSPIRPPCGETLNNLFYWPNNPYIRDRFASLDAKSILGFADAEYSDITKLVRRGA